LKVKTYRILYALFGVGLALQIGVAVFSYRAMNQSTTALQWVAHTHAVLGELTALHVSILQAESARLFISPWVRREANKKLKSTREAEHGRKRCRDLLVEDNPADLELTLHALRHEHLANRIEVARDREEALDFLFCRGKHSERTANQMPKLILLDLKLPKVDGIEVLRQIRANPKTKTIPVTVLTSSTEGSDLYRCYELGVNSYIQKPVDFDKFRKVVKQFSLYWLVVNVAPPVSHAAQK
jgi:two-component system response regulator